MLDQNHLTVARRGREPGLTLSRDGRSVPMRDWARELLDSMSGICEMLDRGDPARPYSQALATQAAKVDDVALTPSARLMAELTRWGVVLRPRAAHVGDAQGIFPRALSAQRGAPARVLRRKPQESLAAQHKIETADRGTFDEYLARYFAD